jgi:cell division protein FtsI (penicillin-binding protein 3)
MALLVLAAVALTIFLLQPVRTPEEQSNPVELVPEGSFTGRKNIYDRQLRELAVSLHLTSIYARPLELREPEMIASQFSAILEQDEKELLRALRSERSFVWLARRLDAEKSARISELKTRGLYFFDEEQRFYPNRESGAHVLGFLGNEQGLGGVEFYYDQLLQGGWSAEQNILPGLPPSVRKGKGAHLVLTLDLQMQTFLEQELARLKKETGASAAMALVMEPDSGEIHAMVNLPTFDPNLFWRYSTAERRNRVLVDPLFPGNLWNLFRLAAAVEAGQEIKVEGGDENAPLLAAPKVKKKQGSAGPLHEEWVELAPGVHATPSLALLPDFDLSAVEFARFAGQVGITGEIDLDLPRGLENGEPLEKPAIGDELGANSSISAFQLLAAFSRLTGTGYTARPHLLKALLDEEGEETALHYEKQPAVLSAAARQAVSDILSSGMAGSGLAAGMVESLHYPSSTGVNPLEGAARQCRQQNVLLGVIPGSPRLSFLLVLDDACIDPGRPSSLRSLGARFARQVNRPRQEGAGSVAGPARQSEEEVYSRWRDLHHQKAQGEEKPAQREDRVVDLRGLGLRQALQILQAYGLQVEISGSGRVVSQLPKPGSPLAGVEEIKLELRPDP